MCFKMNKFEHAVRSKLNKFEHAWGRGAGGGALQGGARAGYGVGWDKITDRYD